VKSTLFHEVAQIAMFITVACVIIFGLSHQAGDFIMGAIITLLQALMLANKENKFTALHPATLSKFNLDGKVTVYAVCPTCHLTYSPGSYE